MKQMLKTEISFLEQNSERLNISAKEFLRFGIDNVIEDKEHSLCFGIDYGFMYCGTWKRTCHT